MTTDLRQAALLAKDALIGVLRAYPTDTDMAELGWSAANIDSACNAYDAARAALSAIEAVQEKGEKGNLVHLASGDLPAASGSDVPARPTSPAEWKLVPVEPPDEWVVRVIGGSVTTEDAKAFYRIIPTCAASPPLPQEQGAVPPQGEQR